MTEQCVSNTQLGLDSSLTTNQNIFFLLSVLWFPYQYNEDDANNYLKKTKNL